MLLLSQTKLFVVFFFQATVGVSFLCILGIPLLAVAVDEKDQIARPQHAISIYPRLTKNPTRQNIEVSCTSAAEYYPYFDYEEHRAVMVKLKAENTILNGFTCNFHPYTTSLRTYKRADAAYQVTIFSIGASYASSVRYLSSDTGRKASVERGVVDAFIKGKSYCYKKSTEEGWAETQSYLDSEILNLGYKESAYGEKIARVIRDVSANILDCPVSIKDKNSLALILNKKQQWQPVVDVFLEKSADVLSFHGGTPEDLEVLEELIKEKGSHCSLQIAHCKGRILNSFKELKDFVQLKKAENRRQKKKEHHAFYISDAWITIDNQCAHHGLEKLKTKYAFSSTQASTACPIALLVKDAGLAFTAASVPIGVPLKDKSKAFTEHLAQIRDLTNQIIKSDSCPVINEFCNVTKKEEENWAKRLGDVVVTAKGVQLHPTTLIRDENREDGADAWLEVGYYKAMVRKERESSEMQLQTGSASDKNEKPK